TEINYYFNPDNNKQYLVELTDYHYTVPIDYPDSKTASLSTYKFMVCEGGEPNYPGSDDLAGVYNRAVNTLTVIRKSLKISP
ncbi:hypothetical protein JYT10_00860, partial [Beggiatoa alba]|nr:hypothetical protein [Beggiatoa alba]